MNYNDFFSNMDDLKDKAVVDNFCQALALLRAIILEMEPEDAARIIKEDLCDVSYAISGLEEEDFFGPEGMRL